jgi:transcriptional regulator with XRE-family HTH domain
MEESVMPKRRSTTQEGAAAIAERLAALRRGRGITQVELAQKLGMPQGMVSKYENGEVLLHAELLAQFADALDVSADDLLGRQAKRRKAAAVAPAPAVDRALAKRFALIQSLPRRDRDALARTIDAFLSARGGPGRAA